MRAVHLLLINCSRMVGGYVLQVCEQLWLSIAKNPQPFKWLGLSAKKDPQPFEQLELSIKNKPFSPSTGQDLSVQKKSSV